MADPPHDLVWRLRSHSELVPQSGTMSGRVVAAVQQPAVVCRRSAVQRHGHASGAALRRSAEYRAQSTSARLANCVPALSHHRRSVALRAISGAYTCDALTLCLLPVQRRRRAGSFPCPRGLLNYVSLFVRDTFPLLLPVQTQSDTWMRAASSSPSQRLKARSQMRHLLAVQPAAR